MEANDAVCPSREKFTIIPDDSSDALDEDSAKEQFSVLLDALEKALNSGDGDTVIENLESVGQLIHEIERDHLPFNFLFECNFPSIVMNLYFCDDLNVKALTLTLELILRMTRLYGRFLPLASHPTFFPRLAAYLKSEHQGILRDALVIVERIISLNPELVPSLFENGIVEIVITELCMDVRYDIRSSALFTAVKLVDFIHDDATLDMLVSMFISAALSDATSTCIKIRTHALSGIKKSIEISSRCISQILQDETRFIEYLMACIRTTFGERSSAMLENNALSIICDTCAMCSDEQLLGLVNTYNVIEFVLIELPFFDVNLESETMLTCDNDSFDMVCTLLTTLINRQRHEFIERMTAARFIPQMASVLEHGKQEFKASVVRPVLAILDLRPELILDVPSSPEILQSILYLCETGVPGLIDRVCDVFLALLHRNHQVRGMLLKAGAAESFERLITTEGEAETVAKCTLVVDTLMDEH